MIQALVAIMVRVPPYGQAEAKSVILDLPHEIKTTTQLKVVSQEIERLVSNTLRDESGVIGTVPEVQIINIMYFEKEEEPDG